VELALTLPRSLVISIAANAVRNGARARCFFNAVDLVNRLGAEARDGTAGQLAGRLVGTHKPMEMSHDDPNR